MAVDIAWNFEEPSSRARAAARSLVDVVEGASGALGAV